MPFGINCVAVEKLFMYGDIVLLGFIAGKFFFMFSVRLLNFGRLLV